MIPFEKTYQDRRVLVTGHTGFTGGWLCSWLDELGAKMEPEETFNLFDALDIENRVSSHIGNIDKADDVQQVFDKEQPEIVFHLAAQPIVSRGYDDPRGTFMTNVMGTLNVLDAAVNCSATRAVVCVTTDKVYQNNEWPYGYRETDRLGGKDPYSASKAGSEIVIQTYQHTMTQRGNCAAIAAARGGNIIGGGDFAENRIVPDFVRAMQNGEPLTLRNPSATRPWQHVMALVHGYLVLANHLLNNPSSGGAWNFGPDSDSNRSVGDLVGELGKAWSEADIHYADGSFPEAHLLHLVSDKARSQLGWKPPLSFEDTASLTAQWYREAGHDAAAARKITDKQLANYRVSLTGQG